VGDNPFASLLYALLFLAAIWLVALALYRRRIYIKL
jgi:predicted acyltransferase